MKVKFSKKATQAIIAFVLSGVLVTTATAGGVPVFDGANVAQAIAQVQNQIKQIENAHNQLKAITDNGNFGDLVNHPEIRRQLNRYLPNKYRDIFEAARRGDLGALEQVVRQAEQAERQAQNAQTGAARQAAVQVHAEAMVVARQNRLNQYASDVQQLADRINRTANTAQKQDLTNTLLARSAQIQTELGMIQLDMQRAEQQRQRAAEQASREYRKQFYSR